MGLGSLFDAALLHGSYSPRIFAYYYKQWNGYRMGFHRHDSMEIMYVIQGNCVVEIERQERSSPHAVKLQKGEFIVLDANVPHRLVVDQSCRMLNAEFGFAERAGAFPSIRELAEDEEALAALLRSPAFYFKLQDPDDVYYALRSLVVELDNRGGTGGMLDRMLLAQLLIRIGRLRAEANALQNQPAEVYVKQCTAYMHQNYDRDIRVKDVAAAVNLHPGYVQRIFKTNTGTTLIEYLTALRVDKAKMLLQNTDIPVADVSEYVGIGSRQYFHALFKRHTGHTPIEFRQTHHKQLWSYEKSDDF
ncbi:helix-turn-helix transcriptional regulator [Cohnella panacarvi]|uniref:helix-turn-helix transcriptional regulator n=1 Tax=Cohnella panacarvi TaxID=400776 RepID=UPI0004795BA5|nr:AraC family transcriptional regulator [Cohnella panacarvi]